AALVNRQDATSAKIRHQNFCWCDFVRVYARGGERFCPGCVTHANANANDGCFQGKLCVVLLRYNEIFLGGGTSRARVGRRSSGGSFAAKTVKNPDSKPRAVSSKRGADSREPAPDAVSSGC